MNTFQNFLVFFHIYVAFFFFPLVFLPHVTNYFEDLFGNCPVYKLLFTDSNIPAKNPAVKTSCKNTTLFTLIDTIISNMWQVSLHLQNLALYFPLEAEES